MLAEVRGRCDCEAVVPLPLASPPPLRVPLAGEKVEPKPRPAAERRVNCFSIPAPTAPPLPGPPAEGATPGVADVTEER